MSGIFDRLHDHIGDDDDKNAGISPLDLVDLPRPQRRLMRMLMREVMLPYAEIKEASEDQDIFEEGELDKALADLTEDGWLIKYGEENISYEVNLRRKRGSSLKNSFWATLDSKVKPPASSEEKTESEPSEDEDSKVDPQ